MEEFPKQGNNGEKKEMGGWLKDPDFLVRKIDEATQQVNDINGLPLSGHPDYSPFAQVAEYADRYLNEWGQLLLNASRSAEGREKRKYAITLKRLGLFVTPQQYSQMLEQIMSNSVSIDELIGQGEDEAEIKPKGTLSKIKRFLGGE